MNFKKVDSSTIKCYVSNEELEAYGITVEELTTDKSKARKFINYLLGLAREEIGEIEINSMMTIQIQMIRDKGLLLTITSNFWSELPRELKESLIESMEEHLHQLVQENTDGDEEKEEQEQMFENLLDRLKGGDAGYERKNSESPEEDPDPAPDTQNMDQAVFMFQTLDDVLTLCSFAPEEKQINSSLMKDQGKYYLYIWDQGIDREKFHMFCTIAMEYGTLYSAQKSTISMLQSRAESLIGENAVQKLQKIKER